jgi:hypothetical protein
MIASWVATAGVPPPVAVTVTVAEPTASSTLPMMFADPCATPVTIPSCDTLATAGVLDVQVTLRPVSSAPVASRTVAAASVVNPTPSVLVPSVTTTDAATACTFKIAEADTPSTVPVMAVVPAPTPVTTPLGDTVATAELPDVHETDGAVTMLPLGSRTVAIAVVVLPTLTASFASDTETVVTCARTVTAAEPVIPSLVAAIVAVPTFTPVTSPAALTVAIDVSLELHAIGRAGSTLFEASRRVAVAVVVAFGARVEVPSVTLTEATGTDVLCTVRVALPEELSVVATMSVVPAERVAMRPDASTVATALLMDVQLTTRSVRALLFASTTFAVAVAAAPTETLVALSDTVTDTDAGTTLTFKLVDLPSADALMTAVPGAMAVIIPACVTLATASLDVVQVRVTPAAAEPHVVCAKPRACAVWPTARVEDPSETTIRSTIFWPSTVVGSGTHETIAQQKARNAKCPTPRLRVMEIL